MTRRHWNDPTARRADRLRVFNPGPRTGTRYSTAITLRGQDSPWDRELVTGMIAVVLAVIAAAVRLAAASGPAQGAELRHVAQVYAVDQLGHLLDPGSAAAAPLAWLQIGGYTAITDAFTRHPSALAAVREPMVVAAALSAVLLWLLAGRMGLSRWAAGGAVVIVALSPLAITAQVGVRPENVAMPWLLAALVLLWTPRRHRRIGADLWATAFLVVAVITAPVTLVLAVTAAWLTWRRRRRRLSLMVAALFAIGVGFGLGGATALNGFQLGGDGPDPQQWLALDPVLAAIMVFASVGALFSFRLRPLAVGALLLVGVVLLPGGPGTGAVAVLVPLAALLVAGTVECGITHRARVGKHTMVRPLLVPTLALAVTTAAVSVPGWVGDLSAAASTHPDSGPTSAAVRWVRDNLPLTPIVTDENTWVSLIRAGHPQHLATRSAACDAQCAATAFPLATPGLRAELDRRPTLADALGHAEPLAIFGDRDQRVEVYRPGRTADERDTRAEAGTRLAVALPVSQSASATLREGQADPRVLTALSTLPVTTEVRVADLPAIPEEDAAAQPRRQVLLRGAVGEITRHLEHLPEPIRPETVQNTRNGLLVRYPPGSPTGLLAP